MASLGMHRGLTISVNSKQVVHAIIK